MKILYLTHHWLGNTHHSNYSGYQQIVNYAAEENDCTVVTWGKENVIRNENGIEVHYVKPFMKKDYFFVKRLAISKYAKKIEANYDIVHALYTDCGYFQKHPNFYSTFHISPFVGIKLGLISNLFLYFKYFFIERRVLNQSKKIIIVSANLENGLKRFKHKIIYVPHGINTEYWCPSNNYAEINKTIELPLKYVLSVGNNGVDKEILYNAIKENPQTNFIVVGLRNFLCDLKNCKQLFNISDDELKQLYNYCTLFIRPMNFATANNSILEALSMGKPVIISTLNGKYEYFGNGNENIQITDRASFLETLHNFFIPVEQIELINNIQIRNYTIDNFDWKIIWEKTKQIYESKT